MHAEVVPDSVQKYQAAVAQFVSNPGFYGAVKSYAEDPARSTDVKGYFEGLGFAFPEDATLSVPEGMDLADAIPGIEPDSFTISLCTGDTTIESYHCSTFTITFTHQ